MGGMICGFEELSGRNLGSVAMGGFQKLGAAQRYRGPRVTSELWELNAGLTQV